MDAEKLAMQRRIDNLQQHIDYLYDELRDYERQNAKLTSELETVKRERDAALRDLRSSRYCKRCKHLEEKLELEMQHDVPSQCMNCHFVVSQFLWRGVE